ncbi:MAG: hypothetical protein WBL37_06330 [Dehalococcoidales bacterium]
MAKIKKVRKQKPDVIENAFRVFQESVGEDRFNEIKANKPKTESPEKTTHA